MAQTKTAQAKPEGDASKETPAPEAERVIVKKYANRRLYNTASSTYVTLEHLAEMVREGVDFIVYDARTGDDITHSVLTQIIFEQENGEGQNLLPIQFLRQLIRYYGDSMQSVLPSYLELSLDSFAKQQEKFRAQFAGPFGAATGLQGFNDQVRQNLAMFDRAMKMFSPFAYGQEPAAPTSPPPGPTRQAAAPTDPVLAEMKRQMDEMRRQIDALASAKR